MKNERPGRLEGKVAVITGGASGIGSATANLFLAEGAKVVIADIQADKGQAIAAHHPGEAHYHLCDVTDGEQMMAALECAVARFGGLDILFNNAGIADGMMTLDALDPVSIDQTMALLVRAPMLGTRYAQPLMRARGGGAIINTASIAASQAGWGPMVYSAAKAAIVQWTRVAAAELSRDRIRINAISPGLIATPIHAASLGLSRAQADALAGRVALKAPMMQPLGIAGEPRHIAEAALFLASDAAEFVTGTSLVVDGGVSIGPRHSWKSDIVHSTLAALGMTMEEFEQAKRRDAIA
jgi:NAD(P)-dependent dehydrogenase (short-subunit alcohol dehydrogenase family)